MIFYQGDADVRFFNEDITQQAKKVRGSLHPQRFISVSLHIGQPKFVAK